MPPTIIKVQLSKKQIDGYVIPLSNINLVLAVTEIGMVGCGAFNVFALDRFSYPAATVKSMKDGPIATIDDLLEGQIKEVNEEAVKRGISAGMTGREALELM